MYKNGSLQTQYEQKRLLKFKTDLENLIKILSWIIKLNFKYNLYKNKIIFNISQYQHVLVSLAQLIGQCIIYARSDSEVQIPATTKKEHVQVSFANSSEVGSSIAVAQYNDCEDLYMQLENLRVQIIAALHCISDKKKL